MTHGTRYGYEDARCRCDECRGWRRADRKRYYARHPEKRREIRHRSRQAHRERDPEKVRARLAQFKAEQERFRLRAPEQWAQQRRRAHRRHVLRRYGLTGDDYSSLLVEQDSTCAICGKENVAGRELCIDHDHSTGQVRGLLCTPCNLILGMVGDDRELLGSLMDYLRSCEQVWVA